MRTFLCVLFFCGLLLPCFSEDVPTIEIWYVDDDQTGTGTGTINDPFATIQEGIDAADALDEIRVKEGTYNENIDFDERPGRPCDRRRAERSLLPICER